MNWFWIGALCAALPLAATPCARRAGPPIASVNAPAAQATAAAPTVDTPPVDTSPVVLRTLTHRGRTFHIATINLQSAQLRLTGQGEEWTHPRTLPALAAAVSASGSQLVWATNIGIFHEGGIPVGLHVEGGQVLSPLEPGDGSGNFYLKPNGAFLVGRDGARIRTTEELVAGLGDVQMATQSGPILLRSGKLHPALNEDSPSLRLRSGVGVSDAGTVHFAISEGPVRFHELATLFRDELGCDDALYLDGVISEWVTPEHPAAGSTGAFSGFFYVQQTIDRDTSSGP